MSPISKGGGDYVNLLELWQDLQSYKINVIILACKFLIVNKKNIETFLKDGIQENWATELRDLAASISNINRKYSSGPLSPEKIKSLTKIEILTLLDEIKSEIDTKPNASSASTLYQLFNLTSDYVDPIIKKKLDNLATITVEEMYDDIVNIGVEDKSAIIKTWRKS